MKQKNYAPWLEDDSKIYVEGLNPIPRKIVTAANYCAKYDILLVGARHWSPAMASQFNLLGKAGIEIKPYEWEQGFIDQYDLFLTRKDARRIAIKNGQPLIGEDWGELHSENLH